MKKPRLYSQANRRFEYSKLVEDGAYSGSLGESANSIIQ